MVKIIPLNDKVLVRREKPEAVSKGGILIAETAQERSMRGRVLAVGPGNLNDKNERVPTGVEVGDLIIFASYAGHDVTLDGEELNLMNPEGILAVVQD